MRIMIPTHTVPSVMTSIIGMCVEKKLTIIVMKGLMYLNWAARNG